MDAHSFLTGLRWQDVVDIAFISYILFRLYILFRGTYVSRVIAGLALIWCVQKVAQYLGLIVTSWIMQDIIAVAALIIIIIFRNEIRSVLQAKNLGAIFWRVPRKAEETPLEVTIESVFRLAKHKTGALIVFPGKEDIDDVVRGGIVLNGDVSKEIITSIFKTQSPVHDGAVIIRRGRVYKMGTILPLSRQEDLPSYYGTRHRAALGLAEVCDALVIVVSEERGDITAAHDGRITDVKDRFVLSGLLERHLGVLPKHSDEKAGERRHTLVAALVSVLFVTVVWFSFSRGFESMMTLEIPVEYTKRAPRMEILETSVNTVHLQLSGSGSLIRSTRPEQVHVKLNLENAVAGRNTFTITGEDVSLPPGVFLKQVDPQVIEVSLDAIGIRELPVQVDWSGHLADDLVLTEVSVTPPTVKLSGGLMILKELGTLYTEKVSLDSIAGSGSQRVNLVLNPASMSLGPGANQKVELHYRTEQRTEVKKPEG
jgi:diadenylate cyclase